MTQVDFSKLSPKQVWQHFETLCTIPRPSKHEQQLRQHLQDWAEQRSLDTYIDEIGNFYVADTGNLFNHFSCLTFLRKRSYSSFSERRCFYKDNRL